MKLSNLMTPYGANSKRKRLGRGNASGTGTTAGRGSKGQKARSGGKIRRGFEGGQMPLYRRIPKRGFTNIHRKQIAILNVDDLERIFDAGDTVTPEEIVNRKMIGKNFDGIKILGQGDLSKALTVKVHKVSKTAEQKIKAAGGTVEELV